MKNEKFQDQIILVDEADKFICLTRRENRMSIVKTFFEHDNIAVYETLKAYPHPNICPIYTVEDNRTSFTVTEAYLGETTLSDFIPVLDRTFFLNIALQLCDALLFLHSHGIVHRDIKPENIYLLGNRVVLNDFDISKEEYSPSMINRDTQTLGSVGYASPEQYGFSRSDKRSDIYSLGVVLHVMLSGKLLDERVTDIPFSHVIKKCTEMNRDDRYQSVEEIKSELLIMQKKKVRYTLPGFRTNKRYKKIIATISYMFLIALICTVEAKDGVTFYDHLDAKFLSALLLIPFVMIITNYLNIQSFVPRPLKNKRILSVIYLLLLTFVLQVLVYGIVGTIGRSLL